MSKLKISTFGDPKQYWARVPMQVVQELDIRHNLTNSKFSPDGRFAFLNLDRRDIVADAALPMGHPRSDHGRSDFDVFRDAAQEKGLQFTLDHLEIGPDIEAELARIQQILVNRRVQKLGPGVPKESIQQEVQHALAQRFSKNEHAISQFPDMLLEQEMVYLPDLEEVGTVTSIEPLGDAERVNIELTSGQTIARLSNDSQPTPLPVALNPELKPSGPSLGM